MTSSYFSGCNSDYLEELKFCIEAAAAKGLNVSFDDRYCLLGGASSGFVFEDEIENYFHCICARKEFWGFVSMGLSTYVFKVMSADADLLDTGTETQAVWEADNHWVNGVGRYDGKFELTLWLEEPVCGFKLQFLEEFDSWPPISDIQNWPKDLIADHDEMAKFCAFLITKGVEHKADEDFICIKPFTLCFRRGKLELSTARNYSEQDKRKLTALLEDYRSFVKKSLQNSNEIVAMSPLEADGLELV